ncbi:hypothetical protein EDB81DRAFT_861623 [Dactylonectria macrodidyma]|uniref:Fungal N-terminal domain-containing protein n=1 Tax=Dactylonectria macrodidyma TaxID=307937 RepID=A0A9P9DH55_9HYPO|nr:hypothetical protein EDB81DRAFT_861623 [Dactylonectria macrodidyma]
MADPLSVAGSAVGIISLGIQVFRGLYDYIGSVQNRDKDLVAASDQISNLIRIFQALDDLVPKIQQLPSTDSKAIQSLQKCVQDSEQGINELRVLLESLHNTPANNIKAKLKNTGKLLAFGVRRDDLLRMQEKVLALTATSEFALQVINLDLGISHTKEITNLGLLVDSRFSATGQTLQALRQKSDECGIQLQITTDTVKTSSDAILNVVGSARDDINDGTTVLLAQIQASTEALQSLLISQHRQTQSQLATLHTERRPISENGRQLLQKPAAFREMCDAVGYNYLEAATKSRSQELSSSPCSCDLRRSKMKTSVKRHFLWGHLNVFSQRRELSRHRPDCKFSRPQRCQDIGIQFRMKVCPALSLLLETSLMLTTGVGGYSISPQLRCKQGRERGSPACLLINNFLASLSEPGIPNDMQYWQTYTAQVERELLELFQYDKASPYDRSSSGGSLLHEVVWVFTFTSGRQIEPNIAPHVCQVLSRIVKTLIHVGVLCDDVNRGGSDVLECLTKYQLASRRWPKAQMVARTIAADIAQMYDTVPLLNPTASDAFGWVELLIENRDLVHALDLPPLMTAIALRLEATVKSILSSSPNTVFERYYGMTVLHLASSWPTGLSLLLPAGAVELLEETSGQVPNLSFWYDETWKIDTALNFAIYSQCEESCRILLSYGARWDHFPDRNYGMTYHPGCVRCVAEHSADRRKKLKSIAYSTLTPEKLAQLGVNDEDFPDGRASSIIDEVLEAGGSIPSALTVPDDYEGVYIDGNLDIEHFRIFYDAGFREFNLHQAQNILSLICARFGSIFDPTPGALNSSVLSDDTMLWLENTFRLDQPISMLGNSFTLERLWLDVNTSATIWHHLALISAFDISDSRKGKQPQAPSCRFFKQAFGSLCRDTCRCRCSPDGCLPVTMWLKGLVSPPNSFFLPMCTGHLDQADRRWSILTQVSSEILTFLTFEALEMTHTCCEHSFGVTRQYVRKIYPIMRAGIKENIEIEDEEQVLGLRLEQLVNEFLSQLQSSKQPLREFVYGYWSKRMAEECVPSLREMNRLRQAGITIEDYTTPFSVKCLLGPSYSFDDYVEEESSFEYDTFESS